MITTTNIIFLGTGHVMSPNESIVSWIIIAILVFILIWLLKKMGE